MEKEENFHKDMQKLEKLHEEEQHKWNEIMNSKLHTCFRRKEIFYNIK